MKTEINARTDDDSIMIIRGNGHKLKLNSGEVINVVTDKRCDGLTSGLNGQLWYVSHIDSGLSIIPIRYYCYPRIIWNDDIDLDPTTEKNALKIAKYELDKIFEAKHQTFSELLKRREKELEEKEV